MTHHDPFEDLATPVEARPPRPSFARALRARLLDALDIDDDRPPTVQLPERKIPMTENTSASPTTTTSTTAVAPTASGRRSPTPTPGPASGSSSTSSASRSRSWWPRPTTSR